MRSHPPVAAARPAAPLSDVPCRLLALDGRGAKAGCGRLVRVPSRSIPTGGTLDRVKIVLSADWQATKSWPPAVEVCHPIWHLYGLAHREFPRRLIRGVTKKYLNGGRIDQDRLCILDVDISNGMERQSFHWSPSLGPATTSTGSAGNHPLANSGGIHVSNGQDRSRRIAGGARCPGHARAAGGGRSGVHNQCHNKSVHGRL